MLICKLKLRKNLMKIFKVFSAGWGCRLSWAPCCKTWLKFEGKFAIVERTGEWNRGFLFTGFVPTGWAPCCEWTKSWVPCCERIKSRVRRWASCYKWTRNILSRTFGDSFTCVYTRGPWAVEYLAKLNRILKIFSKSFKAMILGFNFI